MRLRFREQLTASDIKELPKASQRFVAPTHLDLRGLDASTASTVLPALLTSRVLLSRVKGLRLDSTCPIHLIPYLLSGCHNIVSVSLRQITALTDDHLRLITSPNLAQIDLTGCWKVTDAGLQHLLATTGKVKKVRRYDACSTVLLVASWQRATLGSSLAKECGSSLPKQSIKSQRPGQTLSKTPPCNENG